MKFGAIDIGTNAARLLVGEVEKEGEHSFVKKISYTRVPLRLGEEVFEDGKISKKKTEDFVKTMQAFKLISEIFDVKKLRAVATSAMREAHNSDKIITKIHEETGVQIEVISGDEKKPEEKKPEEKKAEDKKAEEKKAQACLAWPDLPAAEADALVALAKKRY